MEDNSYEEESLKDEMRNVIEEARMVLPGIQALFGFQTVSIFNDRYAELPPSGTAAHLVALALLALAIALVMTPAAYHRMAERGRVSRRMIDRSSRLITWGMLPLTAAFALDIYVVLLSVTDSTELAVAGGITAAVVFSLLWFVYPVVVRLRRP